MNTTNTIQTTPASWTQQAQPKPIDWFGLHFPLEQYALLQYGAELKFLPWPQNQNPTHKYVGIEIDGEVFAWWGEGALAACGDQAGLEAATRGALLGFYRFIPMLVQRMRYENRYKHPVTFPELCEQIRSRGDAGPEGRNGFAWDGEYPEHDQGELCVGQSQLNSLCSTYWELLDNNKTKYDPDWTDFIVDET